MAYASAKAALGDDKTDFNKWCTVLQAVLSEPIASIRAEYDEFLSLFPLCYGYWQKYAEAEKKAESPAETVTAVYERSVAAAPYCADMWLNYCKHAVTAQTGGKAAVEAVFDRAIGNVRFNPRAMEIWTALIKFRTDAADLAAVNKAYEAVVKLPVTYADTLLAQYEKFAAETPVAFLTTAAERSALESKVPDFSSKLTAQQDDAIKALVVAARKASNKAVAEERKTRGTLERPLASRWFFHVTAVDAAILAGWEKYLDWAEGQEEAKAINLFERSVIVGALYPKFWHRYANFVRKTKGAEAAAAVMLRASKAVRKGNASVGIGLALAYERAGKFDEARAAFASLSSGESGKLVEVVCNSANFERRRGDVAAAAAVYTAAIEAASAADVAAHLTGQLARLHSMHGSAEAARAAFNAGAEKCGASARFWHAFADAEASVAGDDREARVLAVYRRALGLKESADEPAGKSPLDSEGKRTIWTRFVRYAEDHAGLDALDAARTQYRAWAKTAVPVRGVKRGASGGSGDATKRARTDAGATPAAASGYYGQQARGYGAYGNAQYGYGQYAAGYGAAGGAGAGAYAYGK